jgi:hypothetical protein
MFWTGFRLVSNKQRNKVWEAGFKTVVPVLNIACITFEK